MLNAIDNPNECKAVSASPVAMQVYARGGYKVLPLVAGFIVINKDGRKLSTHLVEDVDGAVEFVDELCLGRKRVA